MIENITINEHSSIRIAGGVVLYVDPFHVEEERHDGDVVLFTHEHYDHYAPEDFVKVAKEETCFVAPASMRGVLEDAEFDMEKVTLLGPGEAAVVAGVPVEAVAAYNENKEFHPKREAWVGYVLTVEGCRIYVAGDTDCTEEAKAVQCDIAMVPCGGTYTMNPHEAAELVNAIEPEIAIPTHFGSITGTKEDGSVFQGLVKAGIQVVHKL